MRITLYRYLTFCFFVPVFCTFIHFFSSSAPGQVSVFNAGGQISFVDIGFDYANNEIVAVGNVDNGGSETPSLFRLSAADNITFSTSALTGLGPNVEVAGISPGASYVAGTSEASSTDSSVVGLAWQSSDPANPILAATSFTFGGYDFNFIFAGDAFDGGVVGTAADALDPFAFVNGYRYDAASNSIAAQPSFFGSGLSVSDTNADGTVTVGASGDFGQMSGVIFDENGNATTFSTGPFTQFESVSPNGELIGGSDGFDFNPTVFEVGPDGTIEEEVLFALNDLTGQLEPLQFGSVTGISDSGFAIGGSDSFGGGFIWNETFNGIDSQFLGAQGFVDWVAAIGGQTLPADSTVAGIIERDGILHFAVNSGDGAFLVSVNTIPEPGSFALSFPVVLCLCLRRKKA